MRFTRCLSAILGLGALLVLPTTLVVPADAVAAPDGPGPDDVIILFVPGTPPADREHIVAAAAGVVALHFSHVPASSGRVGAAGRAFLEHHPSVAAVIPDREVEKLGKPTGTGTASPSAQTVPAGVARVLGAGTWFTGLGVGVAIIDTGIDFASTDLSVAAACFTAYTSCQDDEGHGTHVSGIVGAKNNGIDVVGVAPDVSLYAVKVLNQRGRGTDSSIMAGLDWVASHAASVSPPIRVVNMSLGRSGTLNDNPALRASVKRLYDAGIVVVVAAGNDPTVEVSQQVPATYPEVLAVASTTATDGTSGCAGHPAPVTHDTASYFTTDGDYDTPTRIGVTISAPGETREDISKTCLLKSVGIVSTRLGGGTTSMSGTSMAAPHATGVAALLMQQGGAVAPEDVRRRMRTGADAPSSTPKDSPSTSYTFDGEREGILSGLGALATP